MCSTSFYLKIGVQIGYMDRIEQKLIGESLREIGVLVLVFIPLNVFFDPDALKQVRYPSWMQWLPLKDWLMLFFAFSGFFLDILRHQTRRKVCPGGEKRPARCCFRFYYLAPHVQP